MKMKNKTVLTMVICVAVIAIIGASGFLSRDTDNESPGTQESPSMSVYDEIMAMDLDAGYPKDPILVMEITDKITAYLYGGNVTEEQIGPLIQQQRKMYSDTLLKLNDEEAQIENVKAHLSLLQSKVQRLLDIKALPPVYDDIDSDLCTIQVIQYTNTKINNEVIYYLQKQRGLWKIASFGFAGDEDGTTEEIDIGD